VRREFPACVGQQFHRRDSSPASFGRSSSLRCDRFEARRKTRFDVEFNGKTAMHVYDGVNGWKLGASPN